MRIKPEAGSEAPESNERTVDRKAGLTPCFFLALTQTEYSNYENARTSACTNSDNHGG